MHEHVGLFFGTALQGRTSCVRIPDTTMLANWHKDSKSWQEACMHGHSPKAARDLNSDSPASNDKLADDDDQHPTTSTTNAKFSFDPVAERDLINCDLGLPITRPGSVPGTCVTGKLEGKITH